MNLNQYKRLNIEKDSIERYLKDIKDKANDFMVKLCKKEVISEKLLCQARTAKHGLLLNFKSNCPAFLYFEVGLINIISKD